MKVLVVYETTMGRTKTMAEAICEGVTSEGKECSIVEARSFNGLSDACAIAVGSSTRIKRPLPKTRQILAELNDLNSIPAAAFGSYGWSGEAPDIIAELLESLGARLIEGQPLKVKDHPNDDEKERCREFGRILAAQC